MVWGWAMAIYKIFYSGALHAEHRKFPGDKFLHGKLRGNGGF